METPRIDERDWSALSLGERIRQVEVEGYLVLPDLLDPDHMARLKAETARLETTRVDYSVHQRYCTDIQWAGGLLTELVAHNPLSPSSGSSLVQRSWWRTMCTPAPSPDTRVSVCTPMAADPMAPGSSGTKSACR